MSTLHEVIERIVSNPEVERRVDEILRLAAECCPDDRASFLVGTGMGEWVTLGWTDEEIRNVIELTLREIRAFVSRELSPEGPPS